MDRLLVTGGTGTLGRAIADVVKKYDVGMVALTNDEYQAYEMRRDYPDIETVLCDIRDKDRLFYHVEKVNMVVHAAALKHVSTGQDYPIESVKTNILGTENVAVCCHTADIKRAIFISSDKAVSPVNVYGATKLIGEKIFLNYGYSVIRFGNFWGSRGSVIPLWEEQAKTGTITITDPESTRYFIQPLKAAEITMDMIFSGEMGKLFIPRMKRWTTGELAKHVVPDAKWNIIGLQPGEKKHEVME